LLEVAPWQRLRPSSFARGLACIAIFVLAGNGEAAAQGGARYQAFWVDTFNTRLNDPRDVALVIERARAARANALFVQVRRRGDAWYLNSLEPLPETVAIAREFDPLAEIIARGHAGGLEIHAFATVGPIWNQTTFPLDPRHVFAQHGLTPAGLPRSGRDNWLTRTLLPDGAASSSGGFRIGSDFYLDFGHPDAAAYTVNVLAHLEDGATAWRSERNGAVGGWDRGRWRRNRARSRGPLGCRIPHPH
jgi:uncharacterized lipoprotein YddW (UPF0748 family)